MPDVTRRELIVATAATAAAAALPSIAQTQPAPAAAPEHPEVTARYDWIINKWGADLNAEQRADIRRMLGDNEKALATMRAYPLANGDDPALPFAVTRKAEAK